MMINGIGREFGGRMRNECEKLGIKSSYRQIIFHLAREDGLSQLDLVKFTRFKPPTISVTVQNMESEGYIIRKTDPEDSRIIRVYLSEKGRQVEKEILENIHKIEDKFTEKMPGELLKSLRENLEKLIENIFGEDNGK